MPLIKFGVPSRFSSEVKFTAEIECDEGDSNSIKLGPAIKWGLKNGADLRGADFSGADLISLGQRSDGYDFFAQIKEGEIWIKAGCRYFTITEARKHWEDTRGGTKLGDESLARLALAEQLVSIRKMLEAS